MITFNFKTVMFVNIGSGERKMNYYEKHVEF